MLARVQAHAEKPQAGHPAWLELDERAATAELRTVAARRQGSTAEGGRRGGPGGRRAYPSCMGRLDSDGG